MTVTFRQPTFQLQTLRRDKGDPCRFDEMPVDLYRRTADRRSNAPLEQRLAAITRAHELEVQYELLHGTDDFVTSPQTAFWSIDPVHVRQLVLHTPMQSRGLHSRLHKRNPSKRQQDDLDVFFACTEAGWSITRPDSKDMRIVRRAIKYMKHTVDDDLFDLIHQQRMVLAKAGQFAAFHQLR